MWARFTPPVPVVGPDTMPFAGKDTVPDTGQLNIVAGALPPNLGSMQSETMNAFSFYVTKTSARQPRGFHPPRRRRRHGQRQERRFSNGRGRALCRARSRVQGPPNMSLFMLTSAKSY